MSPDIYVESKHIGYAILWGLELAIFYDAFSIFRNVVRHKNFFIYAEDFFYWIACAIFVFENLYEIGDGYIRWYMALGVGIGMLAYKLTLSKKIVKIVSYILNKVKWIVFKIMRILIKPFCIAWQKMRRFLGYTRARIKSVLRLLKKKLTLAAKMLKIALCKR